MAKDDLHSEIDACHTIVCIQTTRTQSFRLPVDLHTQARGSCFRLGSKAGEGRVLSGTHSTVSLRQRMQQQRGILEPVSMVCLCDHHSGPVHCREMICLLLFLGYFEIVGEYGG